MKKQFDPGVIKAQIDNLKADRDRIDHTIQALETALRSIQALDGTQRQFTFNGSGTSDITLLEAVRRVCAAMKDAITATRKPPKPFASFHSLIQSPPAFRQH